MTRTEQVAKAGASATGAILNAQKMMVMEDWSPAKLVMKKADAMGKTLAEMQATPEGQAMIERLSKMEKELAANQAKLDKAAKAKGKLGERARFAETLEGFKKPKMTSLDAVKSYAKKKHGI